MSSNSPVDLTGSLAEVSGLATYDATAPEPGHIKCVVLDDEDRARLLLGSLVYTALTEAGLPIRLERIRRIGFDTAEVTAIEKLKARMRRENPEPGED